MVKMDRWLCHVASSVAVGAMELIPVGFGCLNPGGHAGDGCSQGENQDHKVRPKPATNDPLLHRNERHWMSYAGQPCRPGCGHFVEDERTLIPALPRQGFVR